jgi:N6-L-threonylcarbamoyladenine synthase
LPQLILGIETSCDETSAAVIYGTTVRSNIVSSQTIHEQFGGVVPELASRAHIRLIVPIVQQALTAAGVKPVELDGIAVTAGPGLVGALLVGLNYAKGMAQALAVPLVGVNHIEGHLYGNFLAHPQIPFPHLSLVVSGGHTQLVLMAEHLRYQVIGRTRDDAVGEAFDKGAKLMGLGYPGGPLIDRNATEGDAHFYHFPRAYLKGSTGSDFDFSYSGLKTALMVYLHGKGREGTAENLHHVCASYQRAAVEVLVHKTIKAADRFRVKSAGIVGGVAANSLLRKWLKTELENTGVECYLPPLHYCTDNAAMIAYAGLERIKRGLVSSLDINAYPSWQLDEGT